MEDLAGTKHYDVLGVSSKSDATLIKKAYRKLAAFVTSLMTDTELVYSSIETYVWGVRT